MNQNEIQEEIKKRRRDKFTNQLLKTIIWLNFLLIYATLSSAVAYKLSGGGTRGLLIVAAEAIILIYAIAHAHYEVY